MRQDRIAGMMGRREGIKRLECRLPNAECRMNVGSASADGIFFGKVVAKERLRPLKRTLRAVL